MAYVTLEQLDERLTAIDDLLLKADLEEVVIDPTERGALKAEAEAILETLANELGKRHNKDAREMYEMRNHVRQLNYIAAVTEKYQEAHPEPNPENDRIIAEAFKGLKDGTKTNKDVAREITPIYIRAFPGLAGEAQGVRTKGPRRHIQWAVLFVIGMVGVVALIVVMLTR